MFVKWKNRENHKRKKELTRHYAYLVKNYKQGGKVKQKIVSYLGGIIVINKKNDKGEVINKEFYHFHRERFYYQVKNNLDKANIPENEKMRILESIAEKIPRPD